MRWLVTNCLQIVIFICQSISDEGRWKMKNAIALQVLDIGFHFFFARYFYFHLTDSSVALAIFVVHIAGLKENKMVSLRPIRR